MRRPCFSLGEQAELAIAGPVLAWEFQERRTLDRHDLLQLQAVSFVFRDRTSTISDRYSSFSSTDSTFLRSRCANDRHGAGSAGGGANNVPMNTTILIRESKQDAPALRNAASGSSRHTLDLFQPAD
jgi:hypothetical protein